MQDITNTQLYEKLIGALKDSETRTVKSVEEKLRIESEKIIHKLEEQDTKIESLQDSYKALELRVSRTEKIQRKNNIIIFGLATNTDNFVTQVIQNLNTLLNLNISKPEINNVYKFNTNEDIPPIKVEFVSFLTKLDIFKNVHKLKGSKIFIAHDLSVEDRNDQKILREHLRSAKNKSYNAKIIGNTLKVNDDIYTVDQLKKMMTSDESSIGTEKDIIEIIRATQSEPSTPIVPSEDENVFFNENPEAQISGEHLRKARADSAQPNSNDDENRRLSIAASDAQPTKKLKTTETGTRASPVFTNKGCDVKLLSHKFTGQTASERSRPRHGALKRGYGVRIRG